MLMFDLLFPEDTTLRYRYETRYRTATIMEEDALNKPTAAGEPALVNFIFSVRLEDVMSLCSCFVEADLSLHTLSESPCGSLVLYVIPESSSLLPQVKTPFLCVNAESAFKLIFPICTVFTVQLFLHTLWYFGHSNI